MKMPSELPQPWNAWSELLSAARCGEFEAMNCLAVAVGAMARRFFLGKGLSLASAEEQAVTCVTEIWLRLSKFRGGNFPAWAHSIFLHLLIDEYRKRSKSVLDESDHQLDGHTNGDSEATLSATVRRAVSSALRKLSAKDRLIVRLRHCREPIEFKEIATELGMESGAVRTRYSRAKKQIEEILRKDPSMKERVSRCSTPRSTEPLRQSKPSNQV